MIARRSTLVVANSVLGGLMGLVALFAVARYMGAEALGARAYAFAIVVLFGIAVRLGLPVIHARRLARGDAIGQSNGAYLILKAALTGGFIVVALGVAFVWFGVLGREVSDTTPVALWFAFGSVIAQSLRDVPVNSFRGTGRIVHREAVLFTNSATTAILTLFAAMAVAESQGRYSPVPWLARTVADALGATAPVSFEQGLTWIMAAFFCGEVASLVLAYLFFWQLRYPVEKPAPGLIRDYLRFTLPLMLLPVTAIVAQRTSQIMLGFWYDAHELGLYAGAAKLAEAMLILATGVQVVLLPVLARFHAAGKSDDLRRAVIDAERWISMLIWPAVILILLAASTIVHILLSDEFLDASTILMVLGVHALVASLRMPLQTKAMSLGEFRFAGRVALAALGLNVVLTVILVPEDIAGVALGGFGARGAAFAVLGSGFVPLFAYRRKAKEWTGHPLFSKHLVKHTVAAAGTFALFRLLDPVAGLPPLAEVRVWHLAVFSLLVLSVYAGALAALGEFGKDELRLIRAAFGSQTPKSG